MDTGSPISAISAYMYRRVEKLTVIKLHETTRIFKTYNGKQIVPVGILRVNVEHKNEMHCLELFVLPGNTETPIIGQQWLRELALIQLNKKEGSIRINSVKNSESEAIVKQFNAVWSDKLGTYKGGKFSLQLKPNTTPVFCKPRPVAYALRERVEEELDRLQSEGIVEAVKSSEWATPLVAIPKSNGQMRLCGDYKITLNPNLVVDRFPIPRVSDILEKLDKGLVSSKMDLAQAYQQIELEEQSKNLTTITTHRGLFRFNRLSYGIASAPALFQREMEKILQGLEGTAVYFDDVFITGTTQEEHDKNVVEVLRRL